MNYREKSKKYFNIPIRQLYQKYKIPQKKIATVFATVIYSNRHNSTQMTDIKIQ